MQVRLRDGKTFSPYYVSDPQSDDDRWITFQADDEDGHVQIYVVFESDIERVEVSYVREGPKPSIGFGVNADASIAESARARRT